MHSCHLPSAAHQVSSTLFLGKRTIFHTVESRKQENTLVNKALAPNLEQTGFSMSFCRFSIFPLFSGAKQSSIEEISVHRSEYCSTFDNRYRQDFHRYSICAYHKVPVYAVVKFRFLLKQRKQLCVCPSFALTDLKRGMVRTRNCTKC